MAEIRGQRTECMLQVNTSGSWRNVLTFAAAQRAAIVAGLAGLATTLGDATTWCLHHPDGRREWLHAEDFQASCWSPITATEPAPLDDVMVSVFAPGDEEPVVFMAYRKQVGSALFYLSGTPDQVIRGAYAYATVMNAAPAPVAQQVAA